MPSPVDGSMDAPPSKSLAIRALAAGLLSGGECLVENSCTCDDARAALGIVRTLGTEVEERPGRWLIRSGGQAAGEELDCRESGLSLRLFAAVCAAGDRQFVLRARGGLAR
ncbi:MAG: 3-phosphoshikimate 1-carboxyvinyltransferase, partial [Deltaproteobacteria bacterium]